MSRPSTSRATVALLPLLPVGALLTWWAFDDGGYEPAAWQPGTVLLLALAALVAVTPSLRAARRPTRRALVALGAFAAYTAWSYLSITWAASDATALEGAHRTLLFLAAMAFAVLLAPPPSVVRGAATAVALLAGVAAVVTLVRIAGADGAEGLFLDGRLLSPMGYTNANAAFFTSGALLSVLLTARPATPAPLRPLLLALATLDVGLAVMTASRGWLFTLPAVLLVALALAGGRARVLLAMVVTGVALLPALDALLEPLRTGGDRSPALESAATIAAAQDAVGPLLLSAVLALVAGVVFVLARTRLPAVSTPAALRARWVPVAVAAVCAVAVAAAAVAAASGGRLDRAWEDFKANDVTEQSGTARFSSTGSSRYDFYRVAVDLTERHLVNGIGQDNFAQPYLARRAVGVEEPRWVHSLPLRALTHTGVVGALLLLVALGALFAGALRAEDRATAAIAVAPLVVWTVHGSLDWLWEYPWLSVVALGLAAAAANAPREQRATSDPPPRGVRRRSMLGGAAAVVVALAGIVAVGAEAIAARDVDLAAEGWPGDPAGAFERLAQARSLSPSARPALVEGVIAQRLGDPARARAAYEEAARREPGDWFAPFQLGLLRAAAGDREGAQRLLADAARRNPKDGVLREAREAVAAGRRFTPAMAEQRLAERGAQRFGER